MPDGDLTFGWERLRDLLREPNLRELIAEHFEEVAEDKAEIPLDVQWDHYLGLEDRSILKVWVARAAESFAGYCCWYVDRHPNYAALYAWASPFYLAPEYRSGLAGYRLLTSCEVALKAMGVRRVIMHEKLGLPLEPLFRRAGYRPYEVRYTKVL